MNPHTLRRMADATAKAKSSAQEREVLDRVLAVARLLSASGDLSEILQLIIDAMRDTLDAERATVFEFDSKSNELFTTVAHGMASGDNSPSQSQQIRIAANMGLAGECAQSRRVINVVNAYADRRFNQAIDAKTGFRTRSILTIPLIGHDGELVGVAQVLNKKVHSFGPDDERLAEALAAHAAIALRRGRLIEDRLMRQKLEHDLELARDIQQSGFPAKMPSVSGFDIAAWNQPADQTGGDTYDVIEREPNAHGSAKDGAGRVVLLMADATGHGIGPALSVTQLRSMVRMAVRLGAELEQIIEFANRELCQDLPSGRFITAWVGEIDRVQGEVTSLSAGQAPLLHYRSAMGQLEAIDATVIPLGIMDPIGSSPPMRIMLEDGDVFAVLSDGILEATNRDGAQFGIARAEQWLRQFSREAATTMIERLQHQLREFTEGAALSDDRTAIIIARRHVAGVHT
jgi:phosphoserine phosphatase RsbU/P